MKIEDVRKGSVIKDEYGLKYLVFKVDVERNVIEALDQEFDNVSLGINPWLKNYNLIENINMDYVIECLKS